MERIYRWLGYSSSENVQNKDSLQMYAFIEKTKPYHLTIRDLKNMKPGDKLDVVMWDANFEEYWIWDNATPMKPYDPKDFFAANRATITVSAERPHPNMIAFNVNGEDGHVFIDMSALDTNWDWVAPDKDGKIHITTEELCEGDEIPSDWKSKHIHWTQFSENTRVGWRGPMMLWSRLNKDDLTQVGCSPLVHYKEDAYEFFE